MVTQLRRRAMLKKLDHYIKAMSNNYTRVMEKQRLLLTESHNSGLP